MFILVVIMQIPCSMSKFLMSYSVRHLYMCNMPNTSLSSKLVLPLSRVKTVKAISSSVFLSTLLDKYVKLCDLSELKHR